MSTAEQIIAEHRDGGYLDGRRHCLCGWSTIDHEGIDPAAEHAAHVVAALTNAGKQIVELPEADVTGAETDDEHGYSEWNTGCGTVITYTNGIIEIPAEYNFDAPRDSVRQFAAALLAAARVAEGGDQP
ncbi:hypothetical protein GS432_19455 [Rhodococcus hoagii]|nr:hypothetical protein [Prescottella equi]MBM4577737.1 hypothetical protein [Prescottella equi]